MNSRHYNHEKLKDLREKAELTQDEVAQQLKVHRKTVCRAEYGEIASYELLCSFSQLYDIDVIDLLYARPIDEAA